MAKQLSNIPLWFERQLPMRPQAAPRVLPPTGTSGLSFAQTLAQASQQRPLGPARPLTPPKPLLPQHPLPARPNQAQADPRQKLYQPPTAQRPGAATPSVTQKPSTPARPTPPPAPNPAPPADDGGLGPETGLPLGPFAPQGPSTSQPPKPAPAPQTPPHTPPQTTAWMTLDQYPHPQGDNGRGLHWVPTTSQTPAVVDRFVAEAQRMGVKWVTFLNKGANLGENDYLVKKLAAAGIEPIMRIYVRGLDPVEGDVTSMVKHYVDLGVHYFQAYNEPNLAYEQPGGPPSVDRYLDAWLPVARQIVAGGGLPGFGAMAPGGDIDDVKFLQDALEGLRRRGELRMLDKGWLSMHNYTWNEPINQDDIQNPNGFEKFRTYERIVRQALGRDLPIIGTEGGTYAGDHQDAGRPAVTEAQAVDMARQAYRYMRDQREPWNFVYSYWVIANGSDPSFSHQALFRDDGTTSPIVSALREMGQGQA
jgi:hypothetical protein